MSMHMPMRDRIEAALQGALSLPAHGVQAPPPRLMAAVRHAVFPAGARIRPQLVLAVAWACGEDDPALTDAAAVAVELLHCASLVHDDLPCFDDAAIRRGRPSVHRAFGERLAVLAGDALIVQAWQALARCGSTRPHRIVQLMGLLGEGVGLAGGIVAGQAWECEPKVDLQDYQQAKTGALFAAATAAGAASAGADAGCWMLLGHRLGEAYQVADDIRDAAGSLSEIGKLPGRDALLGRPSAAAEHGLAGALAAFDALVEQAAASVPDVPGAGRLQALVRAEAERLVPDHLRAVAGAEPARRPLPQAARATA